MGSVGVMQRAGATRHSVILRLINLLLYPSNTWMANGGHRHTESRRDPSSASHLLCIIFYRMMIMSEALEVIHLVKQRNLDG